MRHTFFLFLFLIVLPFSLFAQPPIEIEIDFPCERDSLFGVTMYHKGVIGPESPDSEVELPMPAKISLKNKTQKPIQNLNINLTIEAPLTFFNAQGGTSQEYVWELNTLAPEKTESIKVNIKRPPIDKIETQQATLHYSVQGFQEPNPIQLSGNYPITLHFSKKKWIPWAVLLAGPAALTLLLLLGNYRKLFSHYSTADIVTLAIFISFYVAGAIFTQVLKTLGAPSLIVHSAWFVYMFILLLGLIRLIPKKGVALIFIFGNAVILNTLLWGFNLINLLTFTVGSAVSLELWFRLTGYGRSFFSAFGSGLIFLIYPVSYYWFFTAPYLYHHYYSLWYIELWLLVNLINCGLGGVFGYLFSKRIVKVVR